MDALISGVVEIGAIAYGSHLAVDFYHDSSFFEPSVIRAEASRGDILQFKRSSWAHFAIYVEDGMVINIHTESKMAETAAIRRETIEEVCGSSKVRINNLEKEAREMYNLESLPVDEIIQRAEEDERQGTVSYSLSNMNCEHYVTKWRYGRGFSIQANNPLLNTYGGQKAAVFTAAMGAVECAKSGSRKRRRQEDSNNEDAAGPSPKKVNDNVF